MGKPGLGAPASHGLASPACGLQRLGNDLTIADMVGQHQNKAGIQRVRLRLVQPVVSGQQIGVYIIGTVKIWGQDQSAHVLALCRCTQQGCAYFGFIIAGPAGRNMLIGAQQIYGGGCITQIALRQSGVGLTITGQGQGAHCDAIHLQRLWWGRIDAQQNKFVAQLRQ